MTTDPTLSMILAAARTLTAMLGGFAIARGWITSDQVAQISGAVVVLATAGFAIYSQYRNKQHVATALATPVPASTPATTPAS